ncbi:MAG: beta strand repeat-containing protein, partial [Microcoleaceae cyanobacterium]
SFAFTDLVTLQSPASGGTIRANTLTGQGNTSLTFMADSNITLGNISGYDTVKIDSTRGAIALADIQTETGAIDLHSYGKITGANLTAPSGINLMTDQGSIDLKNLTTTAVNNISGNVNITTNNGSARIGNINTSGNLAGGQVEINKVGYLTTGEINSSSQQGDGGSVTLKTSNNIEINTINTQGSLTGSGGDLQITTAGNLRVTGTFTADNQVTASIATNGGKKGGAIAIEYRGTGNSFTIGDSSLNGTAGAITDGQSTIQPTRTVPSNFNLQREADNTQSTTEAETRQDNSAVSEENTTTEQNTEQTTDNSSVSRIDQNLTGEIVPVDNSQESANTDPVNNQSTPLVDQERIVTPVTVVKPIINQDSEKTTIANPTLPGNSTDNIPNTTANNTTDNSTRQVQDIVNSSNTANTAINTTVANNTQPINASSIDIKNINQSQTNLTNTIQTNSIGENISDAITSPLVNNQVNGSNITNNSSINPVINNQINLTEDTGNLSLTSNQINQNSNDLINNTTVDNTQPIVNVDSYLPGQSVLNNETNSSS